MVVQCILHLRYSTISACVSIISCSFAICGKLGHSPTGTTLDIYSHMVTASEKKTAETMEKFLTETKNQQKSTVPADEKPEPQNADDKGEGQ